MNLEHTLDNVDAAMQFLDSYDHNENVMLTDLRKTNPKVFHLVLVFSQAHKDARFRPYEGVDNRAIFRKMTWTKDVDADAECLLQALTDAGAAVRNATLQEMHDQIQTQDPGYQQLKRVFKERELESLTLGEAIERIKAEQEK